MHKKKRNIGSVIVVISAIALIAIVCIIAVVSNSHNNKSTAPANSGSSQEGDKEPSEPPSSNLSPDYDKSNCKIKGNISYGSGSKIYHMPGQEYYDSTTINEDYGERWFCSEEEARAAGWRKSKV